MVSVPGSSVSEKGSTDPVGQDLATSESVAAPPTPVTVYVAMKPGLVALNPLPDTKSNDPSVLKMISLSDPFGPDGGVVSVTPSGW